MIPRIGRAICFGIRARGCRGHAAVGPGLFKGSNRVSAECLKISDLEETAWPTVEYVRGVYKGPALCGDVFKSESVDGAWWVAVEAAAEEEPSK